MAKAQDADVSPSVSVVYGPPLPGTELPFGLVEKGVNLLLVVAGPQTGSHEYLVPYLSSCHRGFPYSAEGVADGPDEVINLLWLIARPQTGDRKTLRPGPLSPLGDSPVANVR